MAEPIDSHHQKLAEQLLAAAPEFQDALQKELIDAFPNIDIQPTQNTAAIVKFYATCKPEDVQELFFVVRRALDKVPSITQRSGISKQDEEAEAAAALYCIAACRLVKQAESAAPYVIHVPTNERIICAIIATALFGGELRLLPGETPSLPNPEYVFAIRVSATTDEIFNAFELAVYSVLFENDRDIPMLNLESSQLDKKQRAKLAARIRTIKKKDKRNLALVVYGLNQTDLLEPFANSHSLPILIPSSEVTSELLGMDADVLLAEIAEFWSELNRHRSDHTTQPPNSPHSTPETQRANTVNHNTINVGNGSYTTSTYTQGSNLTELLNEVRALITTLASAKQRETLTQYLQTVQAEVSKKEKADPAVLQRSLSNIKTGAEMLENGGKIIELCNKAYNVIAPIFGLPPSPLP